MEVPQQTITIRTQGNTDFQFIRVPEDDYQPPYSPGSDFSDGEEGEISPYTAPAHADDSYHDRDMTPVNGQNKLRKVPRPQYAGFGPTKGVPYGYQAPANYAGFPNPQGKAQPHKHSFANKFPRIFHYSRCTGTKKAVCIGINYKGSKKELNGCVNDAHNIRNFLIKNWHFKSDNILVLTDDTKDPKRLPTRANMLNAMRWLVKDAKAHDSLFFHYSGHGGRLPDRDSDEVDGYDDVIFPVDYEQKGSGIINDDTLNDMLVHTIPDGCRLTALFDSCHSSSVLDLVYLYHSNGVLKNSPVSQQYRAKKSSPGDVICFSGCEDNQTSADTVKGGLAVGAMSYAFIQCLNQNPNQSYQQLLKNVRALLRQHFSQRPQLSSSHEIDIRKRFIL